MMLKRFWKNAFTMIELLVTVSIIVLLAAMLLPSLNRTREKANCARCGFNLKQLYQASMTFASESARLPYASSCEGHYVGSDGKLWWGKSHTGWVDWYNYTTYPVGGAEPGTNNKRTYWWGTNAVRCITNGEIHVYIGRDQRVYWCPTFNSRMKYVNAWVPSSSPFRDLRRTYLMNSDLSGADVINQLGLSSASRRMLFADGSFAPHTGANHALNAEGFSDPASVTWCRKHYRGIDGELNAPSGTNVVERIGNYHDGRANCIFVDGHVEKLLPTVTTNICSGDWGE